MQPGSGNTQTEWVVEIRADGVEEVQVDAKKVTESVQGQEKAVEKTRERARAFHDQIRSTQRDVARMNRGLKDGSLRSLYDMSKRAEKFKAEIRETFDLQARYGSKLGGFLARNRGWMAPTARLGMMAGGAGWARSADTASPHCPARRCSGEMCRHRTTAGMSLMNTSCSTNRPRVA